MAAVSNVVSSWADELRLKTPASILETVRRLHGRPPRDGNNRTVAHEICLIACAERRRMFYDVFASLCSPEWVDDRDRGGYTCSHMAAQHGDVFILELIRSINSQALDLFNGAERIERYPIHFAAQAASLEAVQIIESVAPKALERKSNDGRFPLHLACYNGDVELVKYIHDRHPPAAKARAYSLGSDGTWVHTFLEYAMQCNASSIRTAPFETPLPYMQVIMVSTAAS